MMGFFRLINRRKLHGELFIWSDAVQTVLHTLTIVTFHQPDETSPFILPHLLLSPARITSAESSFLFVAELFPISCSDTQQKWRLFFFFFILCSHTHTHTPTSSVVHRSDRSHWLCSVRWNIAADRKCIMRLAVKRQSCILNLPPPSSPAETSSQDTVDVEDV